MRRMLLRIVLLAGVAGSFAVLGRVVSAQVRQRADAIASSIASGAQGLYESGRRDDARAILEEALQQVPDSLVLRRELAMQLVASGRTDAAIEQLRLVLNSSPSDAEAARKLGELLLLKGDPRAAADWLRKACDLQPYNAMNYVALSGALLQAGDAASALLAGEGAVHLGPKVPQAHLDLGLARWRTNDLPAARQSLSRALELDPANAAARRALADLEQRSG